MKTAIIIGAGPAGPTAACELLTRTDIRPIVLGGTASWGGISRTVNYKENRIDIGGHGLFLGFRSRYGVVAEHPAAGRRRGRPHGDQLQKPEKERTQPAPARAAGSDAVMLIRNRLSRFYFMKKIFAYPIALSVDTLKKPGVVKTIRIGFSYLLSVLFPIRGESGLEDFPHQSLRPRRRERGVNGWELNTKQEYHEQRI